MSQNHTKQVRINYETFHAEEWLKYVQWYEEKIRCVSCIYRGADKSLARPGRKQPTVTEDFDFHICYL